MDGTLESPLPIRMSFWKKIQMVHDKTGRFGNSNCCHFLSGKPQQRCGCRKLAVPLCTEYAGVDCMNTEKQVENLLRWLFNKPVSILDLQLMHKTYLYIMIMSLYADDVIGIFLRK